MADELFEQMANISKAHAYDIVSTQVVELKSIIRELIAFGELDEIEFTNEHQTAVWKQLINKAKVASL